MDRSTLSAVITQLRTEHERLTRAIDQLQRLTERQNSEPPKKRGRKNMSDAERMAVSARMKEFWSKKRKTSNARGSGGAGS